jgi:hypothetical protein
MKVNICFLVTGIFGLAAVRAAMSRTQTLTRNDDDSPVSNQIGPQSPRAYEHSRYHQLAAENPEAFKRRQEAEAVRDKESRTAAKLAVAKRGQNFLKNKHYRDKEVAEQQALIQAIVTDPTSPWAAARPTEAKAMRGCTNKCSYQAKKAKQQDPAPGPALVTDPSRPSAQLAVALAKKKAQKFLSNKRYRDKQAAEEQALIQATLTDPASPSAQLAAARLAEARDIRSARNKRHYQARKAKWQDPDPGQVTLVNAPVNLSVRLAAACLLPFVSVVNNEGLRKPKPRDQLERSQAVTQPLVAKVKHI